MKAVKVPDTSKLIVMVEAWEGDDTVLLSVEQPTGDFITSELTPAQARRVAKALMKFAEGK